jgi:hypothetical protein
MAEREQSNRRLMGAFHEADKAAVTLAENLAGNPRTAEALRDALAYRALGRKIAAKSETDSQYEGASVAIGITAQRAESALAEAGYTEAGRLADRTVRSALRRTPSR